MRKRTRDRVVPKPHAKVPRTGRLAVSAGNPSFVTTINYPYPKFIAPAQVINPISEVAVDTSIVQEIRLSTNSGRRRRKAPRATYLRRISAPAVIVVSSVPRIITGTVRQVRRKIISRAVYLHRVDIPPVVVVSGVPRIVVGASRQVHKRVQPHSAYLFLGHFVEPAPPATGVGEYIPTFRPRRR